MSTELEKLLTPEQLAEARAHDAKHTPGPWHYTAKLSASESHNGFRVCNSRWHAIADVLPADQRGDEGNANARLIAAAPELLQELRESIEREYNPFEPKNQSDRYHRMVALYSKATGGK